MRRISVEVGAEPRQVSLFFKGVKSITGCLYAEAEQLSRLTWLYNVRAIDYDRQLRLKTGGEEKCFAQALNILVGHRNSRIQLIYFEKGQKETFGDVYTSV